METLDTYRRAVLAVITPSPTGGYLHKEIQETLIVDREADQYLVVRTGWRNGKNYYSVIQHVQISGGQVVIHVNNTDYELKDELVAEGIRRDDIVAADLAPEHRNASDFTL